MSADVTLFNGLSLMTQLFLTLGLEALPDGTLTFSNSHKKWESIPSKLAKVAQDVDGFSLSSIENTVVKAFSTPTEDVVLRLRLSNRYGKTPIVVKRVKVSECFEDKHSEHDLLIPISFGGQQSTLIPAGEECVSDTFMFNFKNQKLLSVSLALNETKNKSSTSKRMQMNHFSTIYKHSNRASIDHSDYQMVTQKYPLRIKIEAIKPTVTAAMVTFSKPAIKDNVSNNQFPDANTSYPDFLKSRLDSCGIKIFVSRAKTEKNPDWRPLFRRTSPIKSNHRFLKNDGVTQVLLITVMPESDTGNTHRLASSFRYRQVIDHYSSIIRDIKAQGISVIQSTISPTHSLIFEKNTEKNASQLRKEINWWISHNSPADKIIDFDTMVRDSTNPEIIASRYDSDDGRRLNFIGCANLVECINKVLLQNNYEHEALM